MVGISPGACPVISVIFGSAATVTSFDGVKVKKYWLCVFGQLCGDPSPIVSDTSNTFSGRSEGLKGYNICQKDII